MSFPYKAEKQAGASRSQFVDDEGVELSARQEQSEKECWSFRVDGKERIKVFAKMLQGFAKIGETVCWTAYSDGTLFVCVTSNDKSSFLSFSFNGDFFSSPPHVHPTHTFSASVPIRILLSAFKPAQKTERLTISLERYLVFDMEMEFGIRRTYRLNYDSEPVRPATYQESDFNTVAELPAKLLSECMSSFGSKQSPAVIFSFVDAKLMVVTPVDPSKQDQFKNKLRTETAVTSDDIIFIRHPQYVGLLPAGAGVSTLTRVRQLGAGERLPIVSFSLSPLKGLLTICEGTPSIPVRLYIEPSDPILFRIHSEGAFNAELLIAPFELSDETLEASMGTAHPRLGAPAAPPGPRQTFISPQPVQQRRSRTQMSNIDNGPAHNGGGLPAENDDDFVESSPPASPKRSRYAE